MRSLINNQLKNMNKTTRPAAIDRQLQTLSGSAIALSVILSCGGAFNAPAFSLSSSESNWAQLQNEGTTAMDANKYWIAEPALKQAVTKAGSFGMNDIRLAKSLGELGRLYTIRGLFAEAEPYLEEQLHVTEQVAGDDRGQAIPTMASLIRFYLNHGTASKAEPLTEDLLAFVEGKLREPTAQAQGKLVLKKGMALEAWAGVADPTMRDPLIEWAIACDAVANDYRAHQNFGMADRLYKAALDLKATVLGKQHLSLANSYDSLGGLCMERKENAEAESYFRDALSMSERILSADNPAVYNRLDKLAQCLIKSGKPDEAEKLYLKAQNFWKEPSRNGDDARCMYALGSLYIDQKKFEEASPVLQKALELSERLNGPNSIGLVPYLQKYAYALYYLGRKPEWELLNARASNITGVIQ